MSTAQEKVDEVTRRAKSSALVLRENFEKALPAIQRRLPQYLPPGSAERFAAIAVGTIQQNEALRRCSTQSLVRGVLQAAEYGLTVDGVLGHAYLVPYKIKGVSTAQFQIGYRGLFELIYRTGLWVSGTANIVCEGDVFDWDEGSQPFLKHKRAFGVGRGDAFAAYAIVHPKGDGPSTFRILDEERILEHRACSKAWAHDQKQGSKNSIWTTHPEIAWQKSAVRELSKHVALATEHHEVIRRAAVLDERIDQGDDSVIDAELEEGAADAS